MKLLFIDCVAGASTVYLPGEVHEVDDKRAQRFIAAGIAQPAPAVIRRRRGNKTIETTALTGAPERR